MESAERPTASEKTREREVFEPLRHLWTLVVVYDHYEGFYHRWERCLGVGAIGVYDHSGIVHWFGEMENPQWHLLHAALRCVSTGGKNLLKQIMSSRMVLAL